MPTTKADLMFHPVRLRIITTIANQRMTASELANALPDVPQTTLYRHLNLLTEGGVLQVVEENPIRGTVERVYAAAIRPSLRDSDLQGMTKEDYEQVFTMFLSLLMGDAMHYLDSKEEGEEINPLADGVEVSKVQLHLSDEEYNIMKQEIIDIMLATADNPPSPERKRWVFSVQFIPAP
jgi:DNA-binding transcriptional ArsR family regulator